MTEQDPRSSAAPPLTNDQLAAQLQKCAILVKRGDKGDPLIRQTIHDLTFFLTGKRVSRHPPPQQKQQHSGSTSATAASGASASPGTVSKHHHHNGGAAKGGISGITGQFMHAIGLGDDSSVERRSASDKQSTSSKNAARAKADLENLQRANGTWTGGTATTTSHEDEWCETHFTKGCACKQRSNAKPAFQRPNNPSSALLANGWVEQQRRSKMRTVWKEVLASLVEGRQPGEETTLWIQREVTHAVTHKKELEALHQIPVKWLEAVHYISYSTDHRFVLKVYNLQEEFVFRCETSEEAAQNWVLTLRSMMEIARKGTGADKKTKTALDESWEEFPEEKKQDPVTAAQQQQRVAQQQQKQQRADPPPAIPKPPPPQQPKRAPPPAGPKPPPPQTHSPPPQPPNTAAAAAPPPHPGPAPSRMTVSELRAIAHGAGIVTVGMERGELEHVVHLIAGSQSSASPSNTPRTAPQPPAAATKSAAPPPPPAAAAAAASSVSPPRPRPDSVGSVPSSSDDETAAHMRAQEELARRRRLAEEASHARAQAEAQQKAEEERRRAMAAEQQARAQQKQEADRRRKQEEERQKLERERKQREEEAHRRRVAELQAAEQRRRQEEHQRQQQQQWQQQQQQWQAQQAEEARRRQADQQRTEQQRRQQEEAYRQWHQQQARAQGAQQPPHPQQQQSYPQQQQQFHPQHSHFQQHPPPPPPGSSPINMKYAKMAAGGDESQTKTQLQTIKHGVLVEWALQPPAMQILRPIESLVTSIHTVFPPKFGVAGHEHFSKWKVVAMQEVMSGAQPDDEKLKKVVKKLRFLLHPDKLPRDFSDEQQFMCRMLWDITHDAFEDHKKKEEELGWMKN